MRRFYTALVMVAVATASFAIGRTTSGSGPVAALTGDVASIDVAQLHSMIGDLPVRHVDSPY